MFTNESDTQSNPRGSSHTHTEETHRARGYFTADFGSSRSSLPPPVRLDAWRLSCQTVRVEYKKLRAFGEKKQEVRAMCQEESRVHTHSRDGVSLLLLSKLCLESFEDEPPRSAGPIT
jgi:hypothetical protein